MKNKNKKLMIVVACLLVVIGVSFAYFAASNFIGGSGSSADFTTATVQGSELRVEGNIEFNDLDIYPGHENVSSIKVTATGDNELIPYNVIWEGTNTLNTPLNYTIYKTSSEVDVSARCEKQKGVIDGAMMYYEECEISNVDSLGTAISSGTINSNETKVTLITDEFITSTSTGEEIYYYVILEYPNLEENQNSDIGGTFSGKVTVELSDAEPDITIIGTYIEEDGEYKEVEEIPTTGYKLNLEKSSCSNGTTLGWDSNNNRIYVENLNQSGTECTLYYDEYNPYVGKDYILSHYDTVLTRNDFSTTVTNTTTGTIYKSLDSTQHDADGEVYYFAGNPTDNWVQFGGFYWRIIRINGNGSIRMIYQGINTNPTGTGTQIGTSSFNSMAADNMYVGFKYTSGNVHGTGANSTILDVLNTWYQNNLLSYADKIDENAGFCGDRMPSTSSSSINNSGGTGTTVTYYAGYMRLITNKQPSFECSNSSDLYTISESSQGNKTLTYSIGLISADEVSFAGGLWGTTNSSYYLYTEQYYWTMTPYWYNNNLAQLFGVYSGGYLAAPHVVSAWGVRPVINLKGDIQLIGSGTSVDPYRIA